jgi:hypothetical protein
LQSTVIPTTVYSAPPLSAPSLNEAPGPAPASNFYTPPQQPIISPQYEWDTTRYEAHCFSQVDGLILGNRALPQTYSRPAAVDLHPETYNMSADHNIYQAPKSYPEPPKNICYQIPPPQANAERPKPFFAWETNQAKPTSVFIEDLKPRSPYLTPLVKNDEEDKCNIEDEADRLVDMAETDDRLEYLLQHFPRLTLSERAELDLHHHTVHTLLQYAGEQEGRERK